MLGKEPSHIQYDGEEFVRCKRYNRDKKYYTYQEEEGRSIIKANGHDRKKNHKFLSTFNHPFYADEHPPEIIDI